jgi:outer membrane protein TolC
MTIFSRKDALRLKIILRFITLLVLLITVFHGNSDASDKQEDGLLAPPVEDLVAEALEKSPAVGADRSRLAASNELIEPAFALPDPELDFSL